MAGNDARRAGLGYRFETARTSAGVTLCITPYTDHGDREGRLYSFTDDEVRGLIAVLDIVPQTQESQLCET